MTSRQAGVAAGLVGGTLAGVSGVTMLELQCANGRCAGKRS
jgi:hypothetical protein